MDIYVKRIQFVCILTKKNQAEKLKNHKNKKNDKNRVNVDVQVTLDWFLV